MPPVLIRNALHPEYPPPLLLVDGDTVHAPTPALLDVIGGFADDGHGGWIAAARGRSGYGYIDGRGEWLVAPTLQDARAFSTDGLARFQAGGLWGYLDLRGATVIAPRFAEAGAFCQGLAPVKIDDAWRYIDRSGAFAFEAAFSRAGNFSEVGLAFAKARNAARFGFIDRTGNWAIAPQFWYSPGFSRQGVAPVALNDRESGLIDTAGNWIVAPRYSSIEAFDDAGYACCRVSTPGAREQIAWLDTSGREVIPLQEDLANYMADGLVRRGFSRFVGLDGEFATSVPLEWADHFNGHGFTVACTGTSALCWGVLRTDGHFQQAPEGVLEPLTAPDGEILPAEPGTPLVPFLTHDHGIALLDRHGAIAYRLEREPDGAMDIIVLQAAGEAGGRTLWRSEPVEGSARPRRFLDPVPDQFLEGLTDPAQVTDLAASLLAQTRGKLAQLVSGELRRADEDGEEAWNGQDEDNYASNRDGYDEDDPGGPAAAVRTSQRVFRSFLDESTWGTYPYLSEVHIALMKRTHEDMVAKLTAAFGPRAISPDYAVRGSGRSTSAWAFGEEPQRLWVGIKPVTDTMGGAIWCHLWLHCAPSLASLKAALAAAPGSWAYDEDDEDGWTFDEEALGMAAPYADAPLRNHHAWVAQVGGYDGWLQEVSATPGHLAHVPPALLDDAMVDAALHADPEAYHHVPTSFHTPARLEALIRKGLAYALRLPLSCMTAQGLALARTLYGDTPPWQRADRQRSAPPQRPLNSASLMNVWGCCIDADVAIDAVRAGAPVNQVPRWLRSDALIEAALDDDIDNLRWLDRDQVTPTMAARVARVRHGDLMAFIPTQLLTPELCLAAVRANGRALEFVPPESITASLGAAAVEEAEHALEYVPPALRPAVMRALADSGTYWYD